MDETQQKQEDAALPVPPDQSSSVAGEAAVTNAAEAAVTNAAEAPSSNSGQTDLDDVDGEQAMAEAVEGIGSLNLSEDIPLNDEQDFLSITETGLGQKSFGEFLRRTAPKNHVDWFFFHSDALRYFRYKETGREESKLKSTKGYILKDYYNEESHSKLTSDDPKLQKLLSLAISFGNDTDKLDDVILMKLHSKAKNMLVENYFKIYCESEEHTNYVRGQSEIVRNLDTGEICHIEQSENYFEHMYTTFNNNEKERKEKGDGAYFKFLFSGIGDGEKVADDKTKDKKAPEEKEKKSGTTSSGSRFGSTFGTWFRKGGGKDTSDGQRISLEDFEIIRVLGKGSFGKVLLVIRKKDNLIFAMKVLKKSGMTERNRRHAEAERAILASTSHPFISSLRFAFQTPQRLYLGMDFLSGGDLHYHLSREKVFPERKACFYAAEITLALSHLHQNNIIYRDVKPENCMMADDGHVRLVDFGLSKQDVSSPLGARTVVGTPNYVAPEVLTAETPGFDEGYGKAADWWSLGVMIFEMLSGRAPFYDRNRRKMFWNILHKELRIPANLSPQAQGLIRGLLRRDPSVRFGAWQSPPQEIIQHPFFAHIDWQKLLKKEIEPPWKPESLLDPANPKYLHRRVQGLPVDNSPEESKGYLSAMSGKDTFERFTFVDPQLSMHGFDEDLTTLGRGQNLKSSS